MAVTPGPDLPGTQGTLMVDFSTDAPILKGFANNRYVTSLDADLYFADYAYPGDEPVTTVMRVGDLASGILPEDDWTEAWTYQNLAVNTVTSNATHLIAGGGVYAMDPTSGDIIVSQLPEFYDLEVHADPDIQGLNDSVRYAVLRNPDYTDWENPGGQPSLVDMLAGTEYLVTSEAANDVVDLLANTSLTAQPQHGLLARYDKTEPELPTPAQIPKTLLGSIVHPNDGSTDLAGYVNRFLVPDRFTGVPSFWTTAEFFVEVDGGLPANVDITLFLNQPGFGLQFVARVPDLPQLPTYGQAVEDISYYNDIYNRAWSGWVQDGQPDTGDYQFHIMITTDGTLDSDPGHIMEKIQSFGIQGTYTQTAPEDVPSGSMRITFVNLTGDTVVEPTQAEILEHGPIVVGWEEQKLGYRRVSASHWTVVTGMEGRQYNDDGGGYAIKTSFAVHRADAPVVEVVLDEDLLESRRRFT